MISYRDRTYCPAEECKNFHACPRALTDEVKAAAQAWWGGPGAPICTFSDPPELDCYEKKSQEQEEA